MTGTLRRCLFAEERHADYLQESLAVILWNLVQKLRFYFNFPVSEDRNKSMD
jgi:hypothetical protein